MKENETGAGERLYQALFEAQPQISWVNRPDGKVEYFNSLWTQYTGLSPRPKTNAEWLEAVLPEDRGQAIAIRQEAISRGEPYQVDLRFRRADGVYRWHQCRVVPLRDENGGIFAWLGTAADVDDIREARRAAEEANRAKDQFLAILSHELRTPLTPVLTLAQMLETSPELPPKLRAWSEMIRRNVELETRLIDDLLDHTRISHGKVELRPAPVDIHEKIRQTCVLCEGEAREKRLDLVTVAGAARSWVQADPARLQQVLWNLVKNAVKFTPEGGTVTILTADAGNGGILIEVRDTGAGIESDLLPRVFDVFEQGGREVTRRFGGLGLGLAISKGLTELHGGLLTATSAGPGRGAVFTLWLPESFEPPAGSAALNGALPDREVGVRSVCKVLIVEDHPDTLSAMAELVEMFGYDVRTAGSVASALRVAEGERIDMLVSDIGLPDGSGLDLMRRLLEYDPGVQGIALTGFGMEEDLRQTQEAGFVEHLTKPINLGQLEQTLARVAAWATPSPFPSTL